MSAITFSEFDGGLDVTRGPAVAGANQLRGLTNAYVTTGKAIQQRPGLVKMATLPGATVGLAGVGNELKTYGWQPHDDELTSQGLPAPFAMDTLSHNGETLTKVFFAQSFLGLIYVVAQHFGDNAHTVHHYYQDWRNPLGTLGPTNPDGWQASHAYAVGDVVVYLQNTRPWGWKYQCTVAGTSAAGEPEWSTIVAEGGTITDGTVTWKAISTIVDTTLSQVSEYYGVAFSAQKVFAADLDVVRFSATNKPRDWRTDKDAGFLPSGVQSGDGENASALGQFRKYLAVFMRDGVQVWQTDPDPSLMSLYDTIEGVGTQYPRAVGNLAGDVYFESDIGVRSVTLLTQTANLKDYDVGTPVNPLILASITDSPGADPIAAYYPKGGQYWLAVGSTAWVYTYSRTAKISAWSKYEFSVAIEYMTVMQGDLYIRSGNDVYRVDESAVDDDGTLIEVTVKLPYMDLKKPGVLKQIQGVDAVMSGSADISFGYDPNDETLETEAIRLDGITRPYEMTPVEVCATSVSPIFRHSAAEPWRLDALTLYYFNLAAV